MNKKQAAIAVLATLMLAFITFGQESTVVQPPTEGYSESGADINAATQPEQKREGTVRIGVVTVKAQLKQYTLNNDFSDAVRAGWYSFLNGPLVEVVFIDSRLPIQANVEAQQQGCDYLLYSTITQKGSSHLIGTLIGAAVPIAASAIPMGSGASVVRNNVQYGATNVAREMASKAAANIAAKDQVTLEYRFTKVNVPVPTAAKALKAKAKNDCDDVFTGLIEKASEQILEVALKK